MKLVSIVIPTYKRSESLERAINSCLNQTYENIEVIVVDDNDPETNWRKNNCILMKQYEDNPKVKYIKHPKNLNGSAARNTGIENASGEYVAFLDDDDFFLPEKVEKQVYFLENNPDFEAVYCGRKARNYLYPAIKQGNLIEEQLDGSHIIDTNVIMIRKSFISKFGGWNELFTRNQDSTFMIAFFHAGGRIGAINEVLIIKNEVDNQNIADPIKNEENIEFFLNYHKDIISSFDVNTQKEIYCRRYRNIMFRYLLNKYYLKGLRIYLTNTFKSPIMFNKLLLDAVSKKIKYGHFE